MRFNKIKAWLGGSVLLSSCLLVYRMTSEMPETPQVTFKQGLYGPNASFRHPHIIMKPSNDDDLEEIDGHLPNRPNYKVQKLAHIADLRKDTSVIVPSNSSKIVLRLLPMKLKPPPSPVLPICSPYFTPKKDKLILDTLRNCETSSLTFAPELELWLYKDDVMCEGRVHIYDAQAVLLRDVVLDKTLWDCQGGDGDTSDVQGKQCAPQRGGFKIFCDYNDRPVKFFKGSVSNYIQNWLELTVSDRGKSTEVNEVEPRLAIAVQRHNHKNLYNTISEIYNAFIVMKFCDESVENTKVLLIDSHSNGVSDTLWPVVFPNTDRIQKLNLLTMYQRMFWSPHGRQGSFVMHNEENLAYAEEFRDFILRQFGVPLTSKLDCKRLRITLASYRDYNGATGDYYRKQNEDEILKAIKMTHSSFVVEKVMMERYDFKDQLELAVNTDLLIGLHGASLTHALFLPSHAGLIEFIHLYGQRHSGHYEALARWRNLAYIRWENRDGIHDGPNQGTVVPTFIVRDRIRKVYGKICPSSKLKLS